ncbi:MAG: hypothetical protein HQL66_00550 [Magnetococcales bacterium]|nr:hypothetical protein [Magnetococcales bacterium]
MRVSFVFVAFIALLAPAITATPGEITQCKNNDTGAVTWRNQRCERTETLVGREATKDVTSDMVEYKKEMNRQRELDKENEKYEEMKSKYDRLKREHDTLSLDLTKAGVSPEIEERHWVERHGTSFPRELLNQSLSRNDLERKYNRLRSIKLEMRSIYIDMAKIRINRGGSSLRTSRQKSIDNCGGDC